MAGERVRLRRRTGMLTLATDPSPLFFEGGCHQTPSPFVFLSFQREHPRFPRVDGVRVGAGPSCQTRTHALLQGGRPLPRCPERECSLPIPIVYRPECRAACVTHDGTTFALFVAPPHTLSFEIPRLPMACRSTCAEWSVGVRAPVSSLSLSLLDGQGHWNTHTTYHCTAPPEPSTDPTRVMARLVDTHRCISLPLSAMLRGRHSSDGRPTRDGVGARCPAMSSLAVLWPVLCKCVVCASF